MSNPADQRTSEENPSKGVNAVGRVATCSPMQLAEGALGQAEPSRGLKDAGDYVETNLVDTIAKR